MGQCFVVGGVGLLLRLALAELGGAAGAEGGAVFFGASPPGSDGEGDEYGKDGQDEGGHWVLQDSCAESARLGVAL